MANRIPDKNTSKVYEFYTSKMVDATKTYGDVLCISLDNWNYIERLKVNNKVTVISDRYNIYNDYTYTDETDLWDFLKNMKFDKIIMNPPYNRNLHLKILEKAIEHLKDENSECVNLSPINIWKDPYKEYKGSNKTFLKFKESVLTHVESIEPFDSIEATQLFGAGINQDLGIYVVKQNVPNMFDCSSLYDKKSVEIVKKILDHAKFKGIVNLSKKYKDIHKESNFIALQYICGGSGRDIDYAKFNGSFVRYNTFFANGKNPSGKTLDNLHTSTTGNINDWAVITFNTAVESENFWKVSNTRFFKFIFANTLVDVNVHPEFLPWMGDAINPRTGLKGYESEWTDEDFYKYFDITEDEKKIIEETMKEYV